MDVGGRLRRLPAAAVTLFLAALFVLWSAGPAHAQDDNDDDDDFVNGEIVVKLTPGTDATQFGAEYGADRADTFLGSTNIHLLRVTDGEDTEDKAERMENDAQRRVLYAEPNFITDAPEGNPRYRARSDGVPAPSSDPAPYSGQYAVGALDLPCAQGINKGANTTVAVLDTGAQLDHPVLRDSLVSGYDFVGDDASPTDEPNGWDDDGDSEVDEMTGHGTHVAGIVHLAAPDAKIIPLRVLDSDGTGNVFLIAEAVQYAVRNGADVVNMSLGSSRESELMEDVFEDLEADDEDDSDGEDDDDGEGLEGVPPEGVVAVASTGNENTNAERFPAAEENVLAVASVGEDEQRSDFSNYGIDRSGWVDIAAPGDDVYSLFPTSRYASWDGTSMAAPFVAGQAALIRSVEPSLPSEAEEEQQSVGSVIRGTARPLADVTLGAGHADAGASMRGLRPNAGCGGGGNTAPSVSGVSPAPESTVRSRTPTISATVRDAETDLTKGDVTLSVDGRAIPNFSYDGSQGRLAYKGKRLSRATHTVELTATDAQGARGTETWSFRIARR